VVPYRTKSKKVPGTNYGEVMRNAFGLFDDIKKKTKRRPYVRSAYFKKEKVFFDYFREHLFQKLPKERMRRLKYFKAAIELVRFSRNDPVSKTNINKGKEIVYRFSGLTAEKELFFVQIKEDKRKRKYLMSFFPEK
jgi:hypothetical protein